MASTYKLLLEAQIDPTFLNAQIKAISSKNTILLNAKFDQNDLANLNGQLDKIKASGNQLLKVSTLSDDLGRINSAAIEYLDTNKNIVRTIIDVNAEAGTTFKTIENMTAEANKFSKALLDAEKFLAKSANQTQTGTVATATTTAKELQAAALAGNAEEVDRLSAKLAVNKAAIVSTNTGWTNFTETLKNNIKTMAQTALGIGLVMGALNQIKEGIQYIKDLNKELTNIQLVTGDTAENTAKLAVGYNDLAKQMGATTIEVAKGSLEYIRQGKSAEDTGILIKNTMMISKLGNMETADATERLTAIMNGFKLTAEETGSVVDKLVALDNSYATSVDEISTAMKYSSNSAQQAGVDFNHLAAYITVISSTTRQSAETIGQAMKTMFARFTDVKAGKIDEDGLGINNVEEALARVNIKLRDSKYNFKDIQDIIAELGQKWGTLNEVEQDNIAKSIAGVRQKEQFLVLMNNQVKIQEALNVEENANGLAKERYSIYLQSIEAAQNKLTASWEKMVSGAATKDFITSFYNGATAVLDFVNALGGIPAILRVLIPTLIFFNLQWLNTQRLALGNSITTAIGAFKSLFSVLGIGTPVMSATAVAEGEVATGLGAITLAEAGATLGLSLLVGGLIVGIKVIGDFKKAQDGVLDGYKQTDTQLLQTSESYTQYVNKTKEAANAAGYFYDAQGRMYKEGYHGAKVFVSGMQLMSESMYEAIKVGDTLDKTEKKVGYTLENTGGYAGEASNQFKDLASTMKNLTETGSTIDDLLKKQNEGKLSFSDIQSIPPEYLNALTVEGDKLKLNIDLIKQKQLADAELAVEAVKSAYAQGNATAQQVSIVQAYYNQLLAANQQTFGAFHQTAAEYDALLWQIANDAEAAGYKFHDMAGKALTSAQDIHDYMAGSQANFNNFVVQAADATGRTVTQVMNTVQSMAAQTANNVMNLIAQLGNAMGAEAARYEGLAALYGHPVTHNAPNLFSAPPPLAYSAGGGGGGSGQSAADKAAAKKAAREKAQAEAQAKLEKEINDARTAAENSLKDQLKTYKDIIDARKKILSTLDEERKYQQDIQDKNASILKLQNQLAALSLDTSAEGQAQKLQVQEELAKAQRDLANTQQDHSTKVQNDALDASYAAYEDKINNAIAKIKAINASSTADFASQLATILGSMSAPVTSPKSDTSGTSGAGGIMTKYHDGGIVGDSTSLKSSEVLAKLMKGEVVVTPAQSNNFLNNVLPSITSSGAGSSNLEFNVNVAGSLDKSVIPDLQKIADKVLVEINKSMLNRGFNRRTDLYATG